MEEALRQIGYPAEISYNDLLPIDGSISIRGEWYKFAHENCDSSEIERYAVLI